VKTGQSEHFFQ